MATVQQFIAASVPEGAKPMTLQDLANLIASVLTPNPELDTFQGNRSGILMGGVAPTTDQGPWIPDGSYEIWLWDPKFGAYFPGGPITPGQIMAVSSNNIPTGWLLCDGSAVQQATYPRLFNSIGQNNATSPADALALQALSQFRLPNGSGRTLFGPCAAASDPTTGAPLQLQRTLGGLVGADYQFINYEHLCDIDWFVAAELSKLSGVSYAQTPSNTDTVDGLGRNLYGGVLGDQSQRKSRPPFTRIPLSQIPQAFVANWIIRT
jgi:Phage Tail Collar Domain